MVQSPRCASRPLVLLLLAGLWSALSGWTPPVAGFVRAELSAGSNLESGDNRLATTRREKVVEIDERARRPDGDRGLETEPLRQSSSELGIVRPLGDPRPTTTERATALARGPPTSHA